MPDTNTDNTDPILELMAAAGIEPIAREEVEALLRRTAHEDAALLDDYCNPRDAVRRHYGRPGPKSLRQRLQARQPRPGDRIAELPAELYTLEVPQLVDGDKPWTPADHPYGFRPLLFDADGQPIPTDQPDRWMREVVALEDPAVYRLARTTLFSRGARIRISTVHLGSPHAATADGAPLLWETMVSLGPRDGREAYATHYAGRNAALRGHRLIVATIRSGLAARRPR